MPGTCSYGILRSLAIILGQALIVMSSGPGPAHSQMIRMDAIPLSLTNWGDEPFGRSSVRAPAGPLWVKWRGLEASLTGDTKVIARCRTEPNSCPAAASRFIAIIDEARGLDGRRKLATVNRAINLTIRYTSDLSQHGVADVWSSPLATFASERGDCEDYAIAKFLALREAGVPARDLRLLLAHNRTTGGDHAVLAARHDARWLILDNRRMPLVEDGYATDLTPLFALDAEGIRQFTTPVMTVAARADPQSPAATARVASGRETLPLLM